MPDQENNSNEVELPKSLPESKEQESNEEWSLVDITSSDKLPEDDNQEQPEDDNQEQPEDDNQEQPVEEQFPPEGNATTDINDVETPQASGKRYLRFSLLRRIEHWTFMASFSILALTGLIQRYATSPIAVKIVNVLGGIERTRQIHHLAAFLMMLVVIYHLGIVSYKLYVERISPSMLPGMMDFRAFWETTKYFFGRRKNPAQQGRFTFEEKIEYWAVVWGTLIMGLTGFFMWNPIITTKIFSGQVIPAAKIAHSMEAVLAVLSIIIWHLYHVFVKTFNKSMYTGKLNEEQMLHEHALELADIKAGIAIRVLDPKVKAKRQKIFFPIYAVFAGLMFIGVYFFVGFEQTAIASVPPPAETAEAYVPLTPTPLPTARPTATPGQNLESPTWDNSIDRILENKCISCHGEVAKFAELDLSSYESTMTGSQNGPVIIPGNPEESKIIITQSTGGHPGQLSSEELDIVIQWINTGAPEK
jgi:formate dehydrogenase gamma subunit